MVLGVLVAALRTLLGSVTGASPTWSVDWNLFFNGFILANAIGVLIVFAIAMLVMNTPAR